MRLLAESGFPDSQDRDLAVGEQAGRYAAQKPGFAQAPMPGHEGEQVGAVAGRRVPDAFFHATMPGRSDGVGHVSQQAGLLDLVGYLARFGRSGGGVHVQAHYHRNNDG